MKTIKSIRVGAWALHMRNKCSKPSPDRCYICAVPSGRRREADDEHLEELFHYMPSFRAELLKQAHAKDIALGKDKLDKLPGKYEDAVRKAIGKLPSDLQALIDYCLPVNKRFEPTEKQKDNSDENSDEQVNELSQEMKEYFKWAGESLSHEKGETDIDESKWATNCINTWCWHMKELKAMQKSNAKYSYEKNHNVAEHDHEAYKDNVNKDRMAIERRVQKFFKDLHSIQTDYYKIKKEKEAEKMQTDEAIEKNVAEEGEETTHMDES